MGRSSIQLLFLAALFVIGQSDNPSQQENAAPALPVPIGVPIGDGGARASKMMADGLDAAVGAIPINATTETSSAPSLPPIPVAASEVEPPATNEAAPDNSNNNSNSSNDGDDEKHDSSSLPSPTIDSKPLGPFYCRARCLATCLDSQLAKSVDECQTICSPPDQLAPCDNNDTQCWKTCGFPGPIEEDRIPQSPSDFMPVSPVQGSGLEPDPFLIELSWSAAPNASLYIVEFFPLNRKPREGENNYFQAVTNGLSYTVRKEDECMMYDARIFSVNYYGLSEPAYLHIPAPNPLMVYSIHFGLHSIQRDPRDSDLITVTVDYSPPNGWPLTDVDIEAVRVTATDCKGPLGSRSFATFTAPPDTLNPAYNAVIGKEPTPAIQVSFFADVLQADCMFHMRVASIKSVCNTSSNYQEPSLAPGVDFRINCDVLPDGCGENTTTLGQQPMPAPPPSGPAVTIISAPGASAPGLLPPGIERFIPGAANIPTPPPLPFDFGGQQVPPTANGPQDSQVVAPAVGNVDVINVDLNGTAPVQPMPILPQSVNPPNCEMDIVDIQPSLSSLSASLLAVQLTWLERQSMQPMRQFQMPLYFTVRYGPIVRRLVDDYRSQPQIIAGYETILRTAPPLFTEQGLSRQVNISGLQRNGLFSVQVCAIYDQNTETYIQWRNVPSHRIDLAALEPFLEVEAPQQQQQNPSPPASAPGSAPGSMGDFGNDDGTLLIEVDVKSPSDRASVYWPLLMAAVIIAILTIALVFAVIRGAAHNKRRKMMKKSDQPVIYVAPMGANPAAADTVKVPLP